ncbi:LacI family DNA-binding transcriptional regulator [Litorihabitans aurantiacus]|uniref:LacI family transcriptional regulator n=1 Tax=Litorihabitans aurantiacus TaxID=1930061 RepID=A0AA37XJ67_9MICO|nr:LacI family DNA-binding transcriptional regulator [Litorihabitans aurantiacus]GMA33365.1 LacI family transcriptional regulator [Litorihabitans aurantiacus]
MSRTSTIGMTEIARRAGVSQKTVSRVVNAEPNVSDDVRRRVQAVIEEVGYRPNHAARALVTRRTRRIGLVTTGGARFGPSAIVEGVQEAARARGYHTSVARPADETVAGLRAAVEDLLSQGVEGLALSESVDLGHPSIRIPPTVPVVTFDDPPSGARSAEMIVAAGEADGARSATEHLLALGHTTVHHVSGPDNWNASGRRAEGWRAALEAAGRHAPAPESGGWDPASGHDAVRRLLDRGETPTALFVANDQMAIGAIHALERAGLSVPDDVSVVGFDDVPEAAYLSTPLTTVRQDFDAITARAVEVLLDAVEGGHPAKHQSVPTRLVVRESTAPPRT